MKKLHLLLCSLAISFSAIAAELVLETSTKTGGVTTIVTVGRVQGEPSIDGSITLTVIPREVVKLGDGTVVSDRFLSEWLTVKLTAEQLEPINAAITAAKAAADEAKPAPTDEAKPITANPRPRQFRAIDGHNIVTDYGDGRVTQTLAYVSR